MHGGRASSGGRLVLCQGSGKLAGELRERLDPLAGHTDQRALLLLEQLPKNQQLGLGSVQTAGVDGGVSPHNRNNVRQLNGERVNTGSQLVHSCPQGLQLRLRGCLLIARERGVGFQIGDAAVILTHIVGELLHKEAKGSNQIWVS